MKILEEDYGIYCDPDLDSNFTGDLGFDELDLVELVMSAEEMFDVCILSTEHETLYDLICAIDEDLD